MILPIIKEGNKKIADKNGAVGRKNEPNKKRLLPNRRILNWSLVLYFLVVNSVVDLEKEILNII